MSECYPTGCNPCTEAISFPEAPEMVKVIVSPLVQWVNQNAGCMTSASLAGVPKVLTHHLLDYRGAVNIKTQVPGYEDPSNEIKAGDWYIQNADATGPYADGLGHLVLVLQ